MTSLLGSAWLQPDSRVSSTHSLAPSSDRPADGRRKLLLIYVHGFMGDETSFQSFPAHVHHHLADILQHSHIVHTKVYPRYKTRYKVEEVKHAFSDWLAPHENPEQDIVLLGHSMGGILTAEVVLQPLYDSYSNLRPNPRHRILGTINFDVPFLGLHPGVVGAGLGSLVRPRQKPSRSPSPVGDKDGSLPQGEDLQRLVPEQDATQRNESSASLASGVTASITPSQESIALSVPENDPHFNPSFPNDVVLQKRTRWSNFAHFFQKHSNDLLYAAESLVTSHLEFGGAMADYRALRKRYAKIRALEDSPPNERVRFVNYYTACRGRPKVEKISKDESKPADESLGSETRMNHDSMEELHDRPTSTSRSSFSLQSPEEPHTNAFTLDELGNELPAAESRVDDRESMAPQTSIHDQDTSVTADISMSPARGAGQPTEEDMGDMSNVLVLSSEERREQLATAGSQNDASGRKLDQTDSLNSHEHAESPEYTRGVNEESKAEKKARRKAEKAAEKKAKPQKDRKFCLLPSKVGGQRDPCWIRVFMADMDEVGAHCGLFGMEQDPHRYQLFVYDVSCKVLDWLSVK